MTEAELARLRPRDGARFLLERAAAPGAHAEPATADAAAEPVRYAGWVITPTAAWGYAVALASGAEPEIAAVDAPAPPELEKTLVMIARLTARAAPSRREDGQPPWPPRVLRWRGPGRGA